MRMLMKARHNVAVCKESRPSRVVNLATRGGVFSGV